MLTVFGSLNVDTALRVTRLPGPGETVLAHASVVSPGGKGANQAHAARRMGTKTAMVGAVGDDALRDVAVSLLSAEGVDLRALQVVPDAPTGQAMIAVDEHGENQIVVHPGANLQARANQVDDALLAQTRVMLMQLEVPPAEVALLAERARSAGCMTVLNASPLNDAATCPALRAGLFDLLLVNATEAGTLCGALAPARPAAGAVRTTAEGARLAEATQCAVIVTQGAAGATLYRPRLTPWHVPALPVSVVDTTGAGDTYAGALAAGLCAGGTVERAMVAAAGAAASLACMRFGAQSAQPPMDEVRAALRAHQLHLHSGQTT